MKDEIRNYTEPEKFLESRMILHRFYKNISSGYMLVQPLMKAKNLLPDQYADLLKLQYILVTCLRCVTDLNFMQGSDAFNRPRLARHNVCEVLRSITDTLNEILFIDTDIHIDFQHEGEELFTELDVPRIEYILFSIIENSLLYGPKDVKIVLRLKQKDKHIHISVKEKSSAIAKQDFEALFDKYKRVTSGTINPTVRQGLSLALAKQAAEEMDGALLAENQKTGLKLTLILPCRGASVGAKDNPYILEPEKIYMVFAEYLLEKLKKQSEQAGLPVPTDI